MAFTRGEESNQSVGLNLRNYSNLNNKLIRSPPRQRARRQPPHFPPPHPAARAEPVLRLTSPAVRPPVLSPRRQSSSHRTRRQPKAGASPLAAATLSLAPPCRSLRPGGSPRPRRSKASTRCAPHARHPPPRVPLPATSACAPLAAPLPSAATGCSWQCRCYARRASPAVLPPSPLAAPPCVRSPHPPASQSRRFAAPGCDPVACAAVPPSPARRLSAPAPVQAGTHCAAHARRSPPRVPLPAPFLLSPHPPASQSTRFAARGCDPAACAAVPTSPARRLPVPAPVQAGTRCDAHARRLSPRVPLPATPACAPSAAPLPSAATGCSWQCRCCISRPQQPFCPRVLLPRHRSSSRRTRRQPKAGASPPLAAATLPLAPPCRPLRPGGSPRLRRSRPAPAAPPTHAVFLHACRSPPRQRARRQPPRCPPPQPAARAVPVLRLASPAVLPAAL